MSNTPIEAREPVRSHSAKFNKYNGRAQKGAVALGIGFLALGGLSACNTLGFGKDGSGTAETIVYDFDSFDEVEIRSAFEVDIAIEDGPSSVEITMDDNLIEDLRVEVDGDRLKLHMKDGSYDFKVDPEVKITMGSITELDAGGAAETKLIGLDEAEFEVQSGGAATTTIEGTADIFIVDTDGASSLEIKGRADEIRLDADGASSTDLSGLSADRATVDISGASSVELGDVNEVTGDASGASSLDVDSNSDVSVSTSGVASVDRG